jgi:hypothetical protein
MNKSNYSTNLSMLDLLFLTCLGFSSLFILSYVQIKEKTTKSKHDVEIKAEFIITITWPADQDCDVDTYVQDPNGNLVFFRSRESGLMHLDRDDLGYKNDSINNQIQYNENREVVTLRGVSAGEYVVNVHMFSKRRVDKPTTVNARLEKINPYRNIIVNEVDLQNTSDEKTVFRFTLDGNGNVLETNKNSKALANQEITF